MLEQAGGPDARQASHDAASEGRVLGDRYRLDGVLGRGGMSTVYRARDLLLERDVAIKIVPSAQDDADEVVRTRAEIRVLASLDHPGLVTLYDAGTTHTDDGAQQLFLVMELVDGPTLASRLRQGGLSAPEVAALGRELADALAAVHAREIVHRDIKPANVLLTGGDVLDGGSAGRRGVKLADFGIARLADGTRLTATGTTVGTVSYLSPEQALGGALGPASDVYALGLVLIECATGRPAFSGTLAEVAAVRLTTSPSVPASLGPDLVALLEQMTRIAPEERPSAEDVATRLGGVGRAADGTLVLPAIAAPEADRVPRARRRRRVRALAVVATLALAGGAVLAGRALTDEPAPPPAPTYPTVAGTLGASLSRLQQSVEP
ncbi:serine/threonine-protein kinase [Cellulomonas sp. McL0617]|uniref:serine/threonine-protein kinase n=1 Tax=Cellulomonas sp. McL0617 TaxID=3415675 RepID=UPI003CFB29F1